VGRVERIDGRNLSSLAARLCEIRSQSEERFSGKNSASGSDGLTQLITVVQDSTLLKWEGNCPKYPLRLGLESDWGTYRWALTTWTGFPFVSLRRGERTSSPIGNRLPWTAKRARISSAPARHQAGISTNSIMSQQSYPRGPVQPPTAWPPNSDLYDSAVLDTERDPLSSFRPERGTMVADAPPARQRAAERPPARAPRTRWTPGRVAVALLVIAQAGTIAVLMLRAVPAAPAASSTATTGIAASAPVAADAARSPTDAPQPVAAPAAAVSSNGRLQVRSTPPGATVLIDGRRLGTAPLTVDRISPGTHRVQVVNGTSSTEQSVTIEPGSLTSLLIPVTQLEGWVNVSAPVVLQVFENKQLLGTSAEPLQLKPGAHSLELRNDSIGYAAQSQVSVKSGELLTLRPALPNGLLQVNAVPWAHVWVDGQPVGDTPLGTLKASLGPHEIRFQHPERGEQVRQVVVSALGPTRVSVDFR